MPLLMIKTSADMPPAGEEQLLASASALLAKATGKPEKYVMVTIDRVVGSIAGKPGPVVFADVRGIGGLTHEVNNAITGDLCRLLQSELGIPPESVYITFMDVAADCWGWNGSTFG
ncbi:MAG: hypothetical protein E4H02_03145 [Lentisphaerales bacterium]|jgi:phenylpyruvate tautomerase PptA (4-oxalocrotonate tautomerase family)|nr:MAG: hypothetical protein E4H02_03145 [Lentisphaerales bacterium]